MTASLIPVSAGQPAVFTTSEATAGERTWIFYLSNTADGSPATGKTISGTDFRISKDGGAFAAATGVVTEISLGWYKMVFAVADLDTEGLLACDLSVEAGVDPLRVVHQVRLFDQNVATALPPDGGLTAAKFGADALAAISASLDTKVKSFTGIVADGDKAISMQNAIDCTVQVVGTFGGGSAQVQVCENPAALSPVWVNSGGALNANGSVVVAGPHNAVRVHLTGSTAPALVYNFTIRKPAVLS